MSDSGQAPVLPPSTTEDIPKILEQLKSDEQEFFEKGYEALVNVIESQQDLANSHVLAHLHVILDLAKETQDDGKRAGMLDLISKLVGMNPEGRAAARSNLEQLVALLFVGTGLDCYHITQALETLLEEENDDAFEAQVLTLFKDTVFASPPAAAPDTSPDAYRNYAHASEALQCILLYSQERNRRIACKAGAIEFLVLVAKLPDSENREIATSCLTHLYNNVYDIAEFYPDKDADALKSWLLGVVLERLNDEDFAIATSVVDFLESADIAENYLQSHSTFSVDLVRYLGRWDPKGNVPFPGLFDRFISEDEEDNIVLNGFRRLWADSDLDISVQLLSASHLAGIYDSVQQAGIKGGVVPFLLGALDRNEDVQASILDIIHSILEEDQSFGGHLFEAGVIPKLLLIFQHGSTETRCLAAATLSSLLQSYSTDRTEKIRKAIVEALTTPNALPHIVLGTTDPSPRIVGPTFDLISNILKDDDEDEENFIAAVKDQVIDQNLVNTVIANLVVPEASTNAADLLAQICHNYSRGLELAEETFRASIPNAPPSFFAALHPTQGGHTSWDARLHATTAAVAAGAFDRMTALLSEPSSTDTPENRRLAVRAMRALLWAEDVDRDIGRKDEVLPGLVAKLVADGTLESLEEAEKTVDVLAEYHIVNPLASWTEFATAETVDNLVKLLATPKPVEGEEPDYEVLGQVGYEKAVAEYKEKEGAAQEQYDSTIKTTAELIKKALHILTPFKTTLATGLLASQAFTSNRSIVYALESFVPSEDANIAEYEPLIAGAKHILQSSNPPSLEDISALFRNSPIMCIAFYHAGVLPDLCELAGDSVAEGQYDLEIEDTLSTIVDLFGVVLSSLRGRPQHDESASTCVLEAQRLFFSTPSLLRAAHRKLTNIPIPTDNDSDDNGTGDATEAVDVGNEGEYSDMDKYTSLTLAGDLFKISDGYPESIPLLTALPPPGSLLRRLLKLFDDKDRDPKYSASLLGLLAAGLADEEDLDSIVALVKQHIQQLTPPAQGANAPVQSGGKKGKKQKQPRAYKPRLSLDAVLERVYSLLATKPETFANGAEKVHRLIVESGGLELALSTVLHGSATQGGSSWKNAIGVIQRLIQTGHPFEGESEAGELGTKLPELLKRLVDVWNEDDSVSEATRFAILQLLSSLVGASRRIGSSSATAVIVVEAGLPKALIKRLVLNPTDTDGINTLVNIIVDISLINGQGRESVASAFKELLEAEDVLEVEVDGEWRGNAYAVKRVLDSGRGKDDVAAMFDVFVEVGILEFAARLLKEEDLRLATVGASLAAALTLIEGVKGLAFLPQHETA